MSFFTFISKELPPCAIRPVSILAKVLKTTLGSLQIQFCVSLVAEIPFTVSTEKTKDKTSVREIYFLHHTEQKVPDHMWQDPQGVLDQPVTGATLGFQTVALRRELSHLFFYNLC